MSDNVVSHHQPNVPMQPSHFPRWSRGIFRVLLVGERNGLRRKGIIQTAWIYNIHHIHPVHIDLSHLQITNESPHDINKMSNSERNREKTKVL
jgi:hypothetical protein